MWYELIFSVRYLLRSKSHRGFVSFFTFISVLCVTIGVAALIVVLAVMTGFEFELKKKVLGMYSHLSIWTAGRNALNNWQEVVQRTQGAPHVVAASPYITGPVLLGPYRRVRLLYVLAANTEMERKVSELEQYMKAGTMAISDTEIVLGEQVAKQMGIRLGDVVKLTSSATIQTPDGPVPVQMEFTAAGFFHTGNYDYDANFGYLTLPAGQRLFRLGCAVHAVKVKLDNVDAAAVAQEALQERLGFGYSVATWMDQNKALFGAVQMEKRVMFIILLLISVVAALNIVSTLVMVVLEKTKDIGILRSLGATTMSIRVIFTVQGLLIAVVGGLLGVLGGTLFAHNIDAISKFVEHQTGFTFFPADVYYLDAIPSIIVPSDVLLVALCAIGLSLLAALFPAALASRLDPVEALRYQ